FGIPGEASAAPERRGRELRRRAVDHGVGLAVIDAVQNAVVAASEKVALVRPVNEMGPAVASRRGDYAVDERRNLLDDGSRGDSGPVSGQRDRIDEVQPAADGGASAVVEAADDQHDRVQDGIDPGQLHAPYEGQRGAALVTAGGVDERG